MANRSLIEMTDGNPSIARGIGRRALLSLETFNSINFTPPRGRGGGIVAPRMALVAQTTKTDGGRPFLVKSVQTGKGVSLDRTRNWGKGGHNDIT